MNGSPLGFLIETTASPLFESANVQEKSADILRTIDKIEKTGKRRFFYYIDTFCCKMHLSARAGDG